MYGDNVDNHLRRLKQKKIVPYKTDVRKAQTRDQFKHDYDYLFSKAYDSKLTTEEIAEVMRGLNKYLKNPEEIHNNCLEL